MCISLSIHKQSSIYWGAASIHYPARGPASVIYASLVKHWKLTYCQDLMISINTSPVQYRNQGKQIISWTESLKAQDISSQAIAFEITENLLMENQTEVVNVLDKVRQQGIAVSIDDFGIGYCSFSYLILKIMLLIT
ncbi:MAG: EAL domain-containing protein (putative c-di-GMP-specific phosphodiesterase class I) [Cognaticolwellia sp.]|jgi:EAL domain-containing protein (putative c-di-GMP-specific phosphodiesterase class I)